MVSGEWTGWAREANCDGAKRAIGLEIASPLVNQLPLRLTTVWEPRDFIRGCHEGIWGPTGGLLWVCTTATVGNVVIMPQR